MFHFENTSDANTTSPCPSPQCAASVESHCEHRLQIFSDWMDAELETLVAKFPEFETPGSYRDYMGRNGS